MDYTLDEIEKAKQLVSDLESFNNRDLSQVANLDRVTEKTRGSVIMELLVKEFGADILGKRIYNMFGEDTFTSKASSIKKNKSSKIREVTNRLIKNLQHC
jgi:hypothetical protein